MPHFQIRHRYTDAVIYEGEAETLADLVGTAVRNKVSLHGAYMQGADMQGADMRGANMQCAYMQGADMRGANMQCAYMHGAYMHGAYMQGADMQGADMHGAYMQGADMQGADMQGANMHGADMQGADMQGADMRGAKLAKGEIVSLRVLSGLYRYTILVYVLKDGLTPCVKMGCLDFTLAEWDEKGGVLKSNTSEFPDDGSTESLRRARAFEYAKAEALAMAEEAKA